MPGVIDQPCALPGDRERRLDGVAICLGAMGCQAEPEGQSAGPAREVVGEVAGVPVVTVRIVAPAVQDVEVLGVLRMRCPPHVGVAVDEGTAVERCEQPLVRIDDEAVGMLDAVVTIADARRSQACSAVGTVDMHPHIELSTDSSNTGEVVDDAGVGRACRGHDREHTIAVLRSKPGECLTQRGAPHPALLIGRHQYDICVDGPCSGTDTRMGPFAGQQQPTCPVVVASGSVPPSEARRDQRAEVPCRPTGHEHPTCRGGESDQVGDVAKCFVLGEHRTSAFEPRTSVDAGGADDEIEEDGRLGRCCRHERQESRVIDRDARRPEHVGEDPQCLKAADALRRHRLADHGAQLFGWSRLVERRRVHPHSLDGVAHHSLGQYLGRPIVTMHVWIVHSHTLRSSSSLPSFRISASRLRATPRRTARTALPMQISTGKSTSTSTIAIAPGTAVTLPACTPRPQSPLRHPPGARPPRLCCARGGADRSLRHTHR